MPQSERERLAPLLDSLNLRAGTLICEPGTPIDHVYFPVTGVIALIAPHVGPGLQVALIGREGAFGSPLVDGTPLSPLRAVARAPGTVLRVRAQALRRELSHDRGLRQELGRYLYVLISQVAQVAVCTRLHDLEERLARWLLTTHDRVQADVFRLKQQTLADMLGVQRTGISQAAARLRQRGLINYSRGVISITDRAGLERASCSCYGWACGVYDSAFPESVE